MRNKESVFSAIDFTPSLLALLVKEVTSWYATMPLL
ncbi:hypothetical protein J2X69_000935 [Algoriphagus sp. 4150]|nr:hypothetical protein [Algoriphagus sp. 4150]